MAKMLKAHVPALAEMFGYQLRRVSTQSMARVEAALADFEFRTTHYVVLAAVEARPGITQNEICRAVNLRPGNLVPVLRDLEERGFVVRSGDESDRRLARIALKSKGKPIVKELHRRLRAHENDFFGVLDAQEKALLMQLLTRLGTS